MWTIDHEADIESDLSAFHRVDDPMTLTGPRYFLLALRLTAYAGVMAARAETLRQAERDGVDAPHGGARRESTGAQPARVSDDTALAMLSLDGSIEHVKGGD